jgi:hypothetical protein
VPRKFLRYALTALAAIALISGLASSSVSAGPSNKPTKTFVGRNDGFVQQSTQGGTIQSSKGLATKKGSPSRATPVVQLYRYSH